MLRKQEIIVTSKFDIVIYPDSNKTIAEYLILFWERLQILI